MTEIHNAGLEDVWNLRHTAMWPDQPIDFVKLKDDRQGVHLGLFTDGSLVSVLSIFKDESGSHNAVIRKVCTHPDCRHQGFASSLIKEALRQMEADHVEAVFLDSRISAVPFYERLGFEKTGDVFEKYGKDYQKMV